MCSTITSSQIKCPPLPSGRTGNFSTYRMGQTGPRYPPDTWLKNNPVDDLRCIKNNLNVSHDDNINMTSFSLPPLFQQEIFPLLPTTQQVISPPFCVAWTENNAPMPSSSYRKSLHISFGWTENVSPLVHPSHITALRIIHRKCFHRSSLPGTENPSTYD